MDPYLSLLVLESAECLSFLLANLWMERNWNLNIYSKTKKIIDSSKLKEFAEDNFKFDEKGRKFLKRVENTVGKGEIARYEKFLLFPQCFQKTCTTDT